MQKIVNAALKAKIYTFEAKAIKFGLKAKAIKFGLKARPGLKNYITGYVEDRQTHG